MLIDRQFYDFEDETFCVLFFTFTINWVATEARAVPIGHPHGLFPNIEDE